MSDNIRILIADDHAVVRRGLRALIDTEPDMEVVGEASNGGEAVDLASKLKPDVILLDMVMPRKNGPEVIAEIKDQNPGARILVLTSFAQNDGAFPPGLPRPSKPHQSWGPGVSSEGLVSTGSDTSHPRRSPGSVIPPPLHRTYADCRIESALLQASHGGPSNRPRGGGSEIGGPGAVQRGHRPVIGD